MERIIQSWRNAAYTYVRVHVAVVLHGDELGTHLQTNFIISFNT